MASGEGTESHELCTVRRLRQVIIVYYYHNLSAVRNQKGVSHPSPAEAPKCYVLHTPKPRVPVSEDLGACNLAADSSGLTGHEKDDNFDEDRVNIRASSVPPPRAVISSPDNDSMIGNKNRIRGRERLPGSKNYGVLQNRHAHCKVK